VMGRLLSAKQIRQWIRGGSRAFDRYRIVPNFRPSQAAPGDPGDFRPVRDGDRDILADIRRRCFLPSATSVITISAPQMLLSASLFALLIGFGIYLGFTWTKNLDLDAGSNDSKNIFITYIVTLGVCLIVYSVSGLVHEDDPRSESQILLDYMNQFFEANPSFGHEWGYRVEQLEGRALQFIPRGRHNRAEDVGQEGVDGEVAKGVAPPARD
jgi:hypothetical protein